MIKLVGSAGFEPATFAVSGRRPNQASPTLGSVLDDEPQRHRRSYSVSSFPENSTCDSYREKRLTFYRLQKLEGFHENEKRNNHIACNRHRRTSHAHAYTRGSTTRN